VLFFVLDQLQSDPPRAFVTLASFTISLVAALTFHESSHAMSAYLLGDSTAKSHGRLSLNPLAHLDPLGTAMILFAGFGWAKPTPVNPAYLRTGPRSGMAAVAFAGPLSNVAVAMLAAIPVRAGLVGSGLGGFRLFEGGPGDIAGYVLGSIIFWNLLLAAFNLIPLVPLDGFKVAVGVLPRELSDQLARLERYGPAPLMVLIMLGFLLPGPGILLSMMRPIIKVLGILVLGGQVW
jgi:Zn-dependent protease